jgi:hypothetical protein
LQVNAKKKTMAKVSSRIDRVGHVADRRRLGKFLLEKDLEVDVTHAVTEYATRYHELLAQSNMIYFLHVSKTAGSTFCDAGRHNGCTSCNDNCHTDLDAYLWNGTSTDWLKSTSAEEIASTKHRLTTCADLSAYYNRFDVTIEGNENFLTTAGLCPEFWNVIIFRDPIARVLSHLRMLQDHHWREDANLTGHPTVEEVFAKLPMLTNNYFIRSLLGEDVFLLPFGSITPAHLSEAKRVLEGFDVLLTMDEANSSLMDSQLHSTLGWSVSDKRIRGGSTAAFVDALNWSSADWESLKAANALDQELWQYAKALNLLDSRVFFHPAFSKVSAKWRHAACGTHKGPSKKRCPSSGRLPG